MSKVSIVSWLSTAKDTFLLRFCHNCPQNPPTRRRRLHLHIRLHISSPAQPPTLLFLLPLQPNSISWPVSDFIFFLLFFLNFCFMISLLDMISTFLPSAWVRFDIVCTVFYPLGNFRFTFPPTFSLAFPFFLPNFQVQRNFRLLFVFLIPAVVLLFLCSSLSTLAYLPECPSPLPSSFFTFNCLPSSLCFSTNFVLLWSCASNHLSLVRSFVCSRPRPNPSFAVSRRRHPHLPLGNLAQFQAQLLLVAVVLLFCQLSTFCSLKCPFGLVSVF